MCKFPEIQGQAKATQSVLPSLEGAVGQGGYTCYMEGSTGRAAVERSVQCRGATSLLEMMPELKAKEQ